MLVFNNQQRSGYEEIASYSPRYYRSIKEMDAVFRLAGWLTDLMGSVILLSDVNGQKAPLMVL